MLGEIVRIRMKSGAARKIVRVRTICLGLLLIAAFYVSLITVPFKHGRVMGNALTLGAVTRRVRC